MQKLVELLYPLTILLLFTLLFFFGLKDTVVIDYNEGLYAEVSRAMYIGGERLIPSLNGSDFLEKSPVLYWAQMLGYDLFGISSFGARSFNAFSGLVTLLIFYFGAKSPLGSRTAFHATLVLGSSIIFVYLSRVAMIDMLLCLFLTTSVVFFYHGVERALQNKGGASLFWACCCFVGLAVLSHGAIGAFFPLATAVIYLISIGRPTLIFRKRWFFPGTTFIILIGFSWYLLLGMYHPQGFDIIRELFLKHHISSFSASTQPLSVSSLTYLIILLVGFMPWFSYLPLAIVHAPIRSGKDAGARFLRLFVINAFIVILFFGATRSRLPDSIFATLPALPGLALVITCLFNRDEIRRPLFWRASGYISALLAFLLGITIAAIPFVFPYLADLPGEYARKAPALAESVDFGFSLWLAALLFIGCSFLMVRATRQNKIGRLFEALLVCSFVSSASLAFIVLPDYDRIFNVPLTRLAMQAAAIGPGEESIILYEIDDRPSIRFASGRRTISHDERDYQLLIDRFKQSGSDVGLTTRYYFERLKIRGIPVIEISHDTGFLLFRPDPAAQTAGSSAATTHQATE